MKRSLIFSVFALLWASLTTADDDRLIGRSVYDVRTSKQISIVFEANGTAWYQQFDDSSESWVPMHSEPYYWMISSNPDPYTLELTPPNFPSDDIVKPKKYRMKFLSFDTIELQNTTADKLKGAGPLIRPILIIRAQTDVS